MKKYILFIISIVIIISIVFAYSVINVKENKKITFSESGYILSNSANRYYFTANETYTTSYDSQIVFKDTEGEKVVLSEENFIHYDSGNIMALLNGVLLNFENLDDNPIIYYNVGANKEIKKIGNKYIVKNLTEDLQFEQAIWKISASKYIVLSDNIKITLDNGTEKKVSGYVEIEYFDNEIVNIYNQEVRYQTISPKAFIELEDGIKLNLGTKIVSQNGKNKMTLEDMVIDSEDNVTLIDINNGDEDKEDEDKKDEEGNNTTVNNSTSNNTTVDGGISEEEIKIDIDTPEIIYEFVGKDENKVDTSVTLAQPKFRLEDAQIYATGISATIQIEDEDDLLSKLDDIIITIENNLTGKTVYKLVENYGIFNIPLEVETLMPNTQYTIIATASYTINENAYTKNFLYRTFVTDPMGVDIKKEAFTDSSLTFNIEFEDDLIENLEISLLDAEGNPIENRKQVIKNHGNDEEYTFDGLNSNTNYNVKISNITYNGVTQYGENWAITKKCATLKNKVSIDKLNYSINKRDGTFTFYIEDVTDKDNSITSYRYIVYQYIEVKDEDSDDNTLICDVEHVIYQRETTNKEITVSVGNVGEEGIVRNKYYGFKVIAITNDNEKYVEAESSICGAFILNGIAFPTVKFERIQTSYPATEIQGFLYIVDNSNAVVVNSENPLQIIYYSDVNEATLLMERTSISEDERTTDDSGNNVIKIKIRLGEKGNNVNGLKKNTSYTFAVYGTLDLKDDNGEYKNVHIGSCIVTTGEYSNLTATLTNVNIASNTFTVGLKLDASDAVKESLSSLDIMLYEGSGDVNSGEYYNWSRTITAKNYSTCISNVENKDAQINSLQDLVFDNTLLITPSFIGGGKESSYTELNYQVLVTATLDGTSYSNQIPIQSKDDGNDNTGTIMYVNKKTSQTYPAAYIIVDGKGTTSDFSEEKYKPNVTPIRNMDAPKYGLEMKENLDNNTVVAYQIGSSFVNTGSMTAKTITYYAWDNNGRPVYASNGKQLKSTLSFITQTQSPLTIFEVGNGTLDEAVNDNATGLHRGDAYFFSYTIEYDDGKGNSITWPICLSDEETTYTQKSIKTDIIYPKKQEPNFVFYPKVSDKDSITYIYSCSDIDKALFYSAHSSTDYAYLTLSVGKTVQNSNLEISASGKLNEIKIGILEPGKTYSISYTKNLNKVQSITYESETLVTQKFEGIVECEDVQIENVIYDEQKNPNNVRIQLVGNDLNRVAAVKVAFVNGNNEKLVTKFLKLNIQDGYFIDVSLLDLIVNENFKKFLDVDLTVNVTIYYDDGVIGFITDNPTGFAVYAGQNNMYMGLSSSNNFEEYSTVNGNMFKYSFDALDSNIELGLIDLEGINADSKGTSVQLLYSPAGLVQKGKVIVQKEIDSKEITNSNQKINIGKIRIGVNVNNITSTLSSAKIKMNIVNPLEIPINVLTVEIWHSKNKDAEPKWSEAETRNIDIDKLSEFVLDNLSPAEYYHLRFKYLENGQYIYTYDLKTQVIAEEYEFETLTTININDLVIEFQTDNYATKYINISYNIDKTRSNMYEKTRYTFYNSKTNEKIELTSNNIVSNTKDAKYKILDGSLIITNPKYSTEETFECVFEQININPNYNVFDVNKTYRLEITPVIIINDNEEIDIESVEKDFEVKELTSPAIGLKMTRNEVLINDQPNQFIKISTTIHDEAGAIYGTGDWGEYELHVYKYREDKDELVEVRIFNSYTGGQDITGSKFNLQQNATNYSVYMQNVDYTYNYIAKLVLKLDKKNKGINALTEHTEQYVLNAITNSANVSIGSSTIVDEDGNIQVRFYDSYHNIDRINKIDYSVFNISNNYNQSGYFEPEWILVNDNESGISYYMINTPIRLPRGTYTIRMNLYVDDILAGQIDSTYIY